MNFILRVILILCFENAFCFSELGEANGEWFRTLDNGCLPNQLEFYQDPPMSDYERPMFASQVWNSVNLCES